MTDKQEIMLHLACAALQQGMSMKEVYNNLLESDDYSLWDIANEIAPDLFICNDDLVQMEKDKIQSETKTVY